MDVPLGDGGLRVPGLQLHVRGRVPGGSLVWFKSRPCYLESTPVAGPFLFCVNRTAYTQPMSASSGTHGRGSFCSTSMW